MERGIKIVLGAVIVVLLVAAGICSGGEVQSASIIGTVWALVPPLIAIMLALMTKEVYSSLFVGILAAALFYSGFRPVETVTTIINDGFIASLASASNVGILLFLVMLGILVALINRAGGSKAYGEWASKFITTRKGAIGASFALGCLIFVDDYFNCLTVGSVMRPISDRHKVSRAKLAYIIDATAAPICMISPISSWAAAVSGFVDNMNGLDLFVRAIPYNFYSLMTIVMIICLIWTGKDFGPMREHEENAAKGDLFTVKRRVGEENRVQLNTKGKVIDLVLPIVVLIIACVVGMIYTGGFFDGVNFVDAFANCDASVGLPLGAFVALIATFFLYLPRKVICFKDFMDCIPQGFIAMVPAILILSFAWTLGTLTGLLDASGFVAMMMDQCKEALASFLPAAIFLVALGLAFSTGTSWGTFSILIPIVVSVFSVDSELLIIGVSACLAGAVCGDHCSPISDTTIMASSGAQCDHIAHVSTQLPYALLVAAVSFVGYVLAGFIQSAWIMLPIVTVIMVGVLLVIFQMQKQEIGIQSKARSN